MAPGQARDTQLSRLEQLPNEILSEIFVLSANKNLMLSSPLLAQVLNTEVVKMDFAYHILSPKKSRCSVHEDFTLVKRAQQDLLDVPWLTYKRFMRIRARYFLQHAAQALQETLRQEAPEKRAAVMGRVRHKLAAFFAYEETAPLPAGLITRGRVLGENPEGEHWWECHHGNVRQGLHFRVCIERHCGPRGRMHMLLTTDKSQLRPFEYSRRLINGRRLFRRDVSFPGYTNGLQIPARLLQGPWTQHKGSMLVALRNSGAWLPGNAKLLHRALADAIRASCVPAILFLTTDVRPLKPWLKACCSELRNVTETIGPNGLQPWVRYNYYPLQTLGDRRPRVCLLHFVRLLERTASLGTYPLYGLLQVLAWTARRQGEGLEEELVEFTRSTNEVKSRCGEFAPQDQWLRVILANDPVEVIENTFATVEAEMRLYDTDPQGHISDDSDSSGHEGWEEEPRWGESELGERSDEENTPALKDMQNLGHKDRWTTDDDDMTDGIQSGKSDTFDSSESGQDEENSDLELDGSDEPEKSSSESSDEKDNEKDSTYEPTLSEEDNA